MGGAATPGRPWRMTRDAGCADLSGERQYSEFVSFLPYVQRCLYGEPQGAVGTPAESPIRIFERDDIATARVTFERGAPPIDFAVENVQLYFFFDVEIVVLAVEIHADDLPLPTVQDTLFRFGRAFPAFWNTDGRGGHCLERVEWISPSGAVLATSDFEQRDALSPFRGGAPDRLHRVPLGVPARAVGGTRQRQVRTAPLPADRVLPDAMDGVSRARQPGAAHSRDVRPTRPRRPSRRSGQSPLLGPIADGFRVPLLLRPVLGSRRTTQRHQHAVSLLRPCLRHGGQCR